MGVLSGAPRLCLALLQVFDGHLEEALRKLVRSGIRLSINSDDAAYFQVRRGLGGRCLGLGLGGRVSCRGRGGVHMWGAGVPGRPFPMRHRKKSAGSGMLPRYS